MILEADGTIRYVSPAIENILGLQTEDVVGRKAVTFVHPVDRAEAIRVFAEARREPGIRLPVEFRLRHESGAWRYLEINRTNLLDDPAVGGIVFNLRDVTEQKQAEKEIEKRAHQQAVVAELGLWAWANEDLQSLMDDTAALTAQTLEVEYCKIMEPLPNGEKLLMRAGVGWEEGLVASATEGADLNSQGDYTLNSAEPMILEDLRTETRSKSSTVLREHGVVSGMSVVIAGREKPFGILQVHTKSLRSFSENDVNFLQATANLLAMAIERREAKESLEEVREAERSRIARDLHDQALQDLAHAMAQAQLLRITPQEPEIPNELSRRLEGLSGALVRVEQEVRAAIYDLSLEAEQQRPFSELLTILVEIQRTMAPETKISLQMEDGALNEPLEERDRQLLRIVGEAITNARRHSGAHNILIAVWSTEETFYAEVKDDGKGCAVAHARLATQTGGMGIKGMHERARLLGADLNIESAPGEGTKVRLELALKKDREEPKEKVSILLVEDHAAVREAMATSFQQEGFEIVGQAESLAEARRVLRARPVDVALIDLGLPDGYGADLIKELREAHPRAQALVLSASLDRAEIARAVERGAAGVLSKSAHLDKVVDSVRRLRAGETLLSLKEVVELLRYAVSRRKEENEARQAIEKLTSREIEVLRALAEGLDSEGIADKLHIALRTERNHVANILAKLGVHSQLQALVFALRYGVVQIPQGPRRLW
jgi:PAS domain S-box-containing protein